MFRLAALLMLAFPALPIAFPAQPVAAIELDAEKWALLSALARDGFALPEVDDRDRFGIADRWDPADATGGDCEDKALRARAALIAGGWPEGGLRIATAWTETREYHAVLTIDVIRHGAPATYVIDNRFPWVLGWDALSRHGYRWDRRQAAAGRGWTHIAQSR